MICNSSLLYKLSMKPQYGTTQKAYMYVNILQVLQIDLFIVCLLAVFSLGNNAYGQCGRPIVEGETFR